MDEARSAILVVNDPFDGRLAEGVRHYVNKHTLPWSLDVADHAAWSTGLFAYPAAESYDGIVGYFKPSDNFAHTQSENEKTALVIFSPSPNDWGTNNSIHFDDGAIGQMAARHFHDQGYEQVGTVTAWDWPVQEQRYTAFATEARRLGMVWHRYHKPDTTDYLKADAHLSHWLKKLQSPIGLFFHQDADARWFLRFCRSEGIGVPNRVGVLGVDNTILAQNSEPPLSSIQMPLAAIGASLALQLHQHLTGQSDRTAPVYAQPLRVVNRESTERQECDDAIVKAVRRKMKNVKHAASIAQLAASVNLSEVQLRRRFLQAIGQSPKDCLAAYRLEHALELLSSSDASIKAISKACGLRTTDGLNKLFLRSGFPAPSIWRSRHRGEKEL